MYWLDACIGTANAVQDDWSMVKQEDSKLEGMDTKPGEGGGDAMGSECKAEVTTDGDTTGLSLDGIRDMGAVAPVAPKPPVAKKGPQK